MFFTKPVPDVGVYDIPSKELFEYYKSRKPRNGVTEYRRFNKKAITALKILADKIANSSGGVVIKGFGYFFVWKIPKRHSSYFTGKDQRNMEGPRVMYDHRYAITFYPVNKYKEWHADGPMSGQLRNKVKENIRSGFKYKMYLHTLKKMRLI